ncbi:MAG TPA: response regulator, partial [Bacteroidota bacterium]|nr:response regulator [Bacteroidota bacterium]
AEPEILPLETESISKGETLLLVEDDEMLLDFLRIISEGNGYKVLLARDGEEAVAACKANRAAISLVLTDIELPKMNGWDVYKKLKAMKPDLSIIIAGAYFEPALKKEMIKGGVRFFAQKPYITEQLLRLFRDALA